MDLFDVPPAINKAPNMNDKLNDNSAGRSLKTEKHLRSIDGQNEKIWRTENMCEITKIADQKLNL